MENITEKIDIHIVRKSHIRLIILIVLITAVVSAGLFATGLYITVENIRSDAAAASNALSKEGAASASDVDLASTLRISTVNRVIEGETFPSYSTSQIMSLDVSQPSGVTVSDLELVTTGGNHFGGDRRLAQDFMNLLAGGKPSSDLLGGLRSAACCLAAKRSAETNCLTDILL